MIAKKKKEKEIMKYLGINLFKSLIIEKKKLGEATSSFYGVQIVGICG